MNKLSKMTVRLAATAAQVLVLILLVSCATVGSALGTTLADTNSSTACHATGDPANPYEVITITNDISPVPVNGCPSSPVLVSDGKITICHATGDEANPYNKIIVSVNGLNGHGTHESDVFPSAEGDCPGDLDASGDSADKITICHATGSEKNPYNEITVSVNGLNGHDKHEGDIIPAPADGCPANKP